MRIVHVEKRYVENIHAENTTQNICLLDSQMVDGDVEERPHCLLSMNILALDSMKPNKLTRHLETERGEYVGKRLNFFSTLKTK
jgi:hypothetical protein